MPLHYDEFYLPEEKVASAIDTYSNPCAPDKECSSFQAASSERSKNKTPNLDVCGMFAAVCRHDHPFKVMDMRLPERMAYPLCIIDNSLHLSTVLYDIGCMLDRYAQRREINLPVRLAVPVFHSYAHKLQCQLKYNPRRVEGTGLTDGEGTERLWSHLVRFANISKGMDASNRKDLIEEALFHYGWRVFGSLSFLPCLW
jgi:hypothetical protein